VRVIVADDAVLLREGMARILAEVGFEVVGQARDSAELIESVRDDLPDVVITDLRMAPNFADEGIEAAAAIRSFAPKTGVMLLSQYVEVHHALRLIREWPVGDGRSRMRLGRVSGSQSMAGLPVPALVPYIHG